MKKIIRLTESDLTRIVKRVIKENKEETIHIPIKYSRIRMKLGKSVNPKDIIEMYNEIVDEETPLVNYSEYGTKGMFYNEDNEEIPVDVILDELNYELNYTIAYKEDEDYDEEDDFYHGGEGDGGHW